MSVPYPSFYDVIEEFLTKYNVTDISKLDVRPREVIISIILLILCLIGLVGNGTVIWLLGFHIKRNAFTTYILNLAVADFGVLLLLAVEEIIVIAMDNWEDIDDNFTFSVFYIEEFMYTSGQLLLTTISIDRCVAVLFPIWHRCHRPPKLSLIISVHMWVLSLVMTGSDLLLLLTGHGPVVPVAVNVLLCYPLMAIATLTLFVKIRHKLHNRGRSKSLMVILLCLLFFLIFGIPVNLSYVLNYYYFLAGIDPRKIDSLALDVAEFNTIYTHIDTIMVLEDIGRLCMAANGSANPVLYFLAGRQRAALRGTPGLKVTLQRLFHDVEECKEDEEVPD